jgi:hypothetical protein
VSLEGKLALKGRRLAIVDAPTGFELAMSPPSGTESGLIVFVRDQKALAKRLSMAVASARSDRLTWVAYPKGGQLGTDLNRDSLASVLKAHGVQPVTQVSLDGTWTALRFRPDDST